MFARLACKHGKLNASTTNTQQAEEAAAIKGRIIGARNRQKGHHQQDGFFGYPPFQEGHARGAHEAAMEEGR